VAKRGRVLVIFNSTGPTKLDQDYSKELKEKDWKTEADVIKALKTLKYPYDLLGIFDDTDLICQKISQFQPDIIFNLVERFKGITTYDQNIASFLQLQGVPFTGCGPIGLALCKNKGLSKKILSYHHIQVPKFIILPRRKTIKRSEKLKFPIFIKPLKEEASLGIAQASFVENDDQFRERVEFIHEKMGQDVIAEEYIHGRELYVSILGNHRLQAFPIRELKFKQIPTDEPRFASYKSKWDPEYRKKWGINNEFAGSLPNGVEAEALKICKKIYRLLLINGYARIDMRLTPEGEIVFLEANPNPILEFWEDFAESAKKANVPYPTLIQKILNLAKGAFTE